MKTIIKWPGGKSREVEKFINLIPEFDRYVEPFFGGGAVFFQLEPKAAAVNDISPMLMLFYQLIKEQNPQFKEYLYDYDNAFKSLIETTEKYYSKIFATYNNYSVSQNDEDITNLIEFIICKSLYAKNLILNKSDYLNTIFKTVQNKFVRTKKNNAAKPFSHEDLKENLKTGFTSGFYMYFRDIYNKLADKTLIKDDSYIAANFYFIREYCYGSMFRYNAKGDFNIPYGGISYNKKNFTAKINNLFNYEITELFKNTSLFSEDFETFLNSISLTERDFIFLDPPYDSEFSEYEGREFAKEDHIRLANILKKTNAQFILIIKNTDFIYNLYNNTFSESNVSENSSYENKLRILAFDKSYTYNVRSRNDRNTKHLIITNIPD